MYYNSNKPKQYLNKLDILSNCTRHKSLFDYLQSKMTHKQKRIAYCIDNTQLYNWGN